jgi:formate dehydrogenase assembly factor FdhD
VDTDPIEPKDVALRTAQVVQRARTLRQQARWHVHEQQQAIRQVLTSLAELKETLKTFSQTLNAHHLVLHQRSVWLTAREDDVDCRPNGTDSAVGRALSAQRRQSRLSLQEAACRIRIDEFTLAAYESGRRRIPSPLIDQLVASYQACVRR